MGLIPTPVWILGSFNKIIILGYLVIIQVLLVHAHTINIPYMAIVGKSLKLLVRCYNSLNVAIASQSHTMDKAAHTVTT